MTDTTRWFIWKWYYIEIVKQETLLEEDLKNEVEEDLKNFNAANFNVEKIGWEKTTNEVLKMIIFGGVEEKMVKIEKILKMVKLRKFGLEMVKLRKFAYSEEKRILIEFIKCEYNCIILCYIILLYYIRRTM